MFDSRPPALQVIGDLGSDPVHLRRALLLFAIVLGLAAIVASFSRTDHEGSSRRPAVEPRPLPRAQSGKTTRVTFQADARHEVVRRVHAHRAAVVTVSGARAGLAAIGGLDSASVEPDTPARFDVFQTRPGRFPVSFTPAGASHSKRVGILAVVR
jgi:hypothetical protein